MWTGRRGTWAALAAMAMIMTGLAGSAHARGEVGPSEVWRVADLSVSGKPAGAPWLDGRVLHKATGETRSLPWTARSAKARHLRLLGQTPHGWLVKDFGNSQWNVWLVEGAHKEKLSSTGVSEGDIVSIALSTNHRRYAVSDFDGDATSYLVVRDLSGHKVASQTFDGDGAVLDLTGSRAVIGTEGTDLWWFTDPDHPGTGSTTDLGVDGVTASIANDSVVVRDSGTGEVGPTSISAPGTPTWWAPISDPRISPDGYLIIGRNGTQPNWMDLRLALNGNLLSRIEVDYVSGRAPRWTTSQQYLIIGATHGLGDRERLVRCTAAGKCRGQSAVRPTGRISLPTL